MLAANTSQWIRDNGGLTRANGDQLRAKVLAPGGEIDPARLFPNLAGHEAKIEPLLERRGLDSH